MIKRRRISIGENIINDLVERGEITMDKMGRIYGLDSFLKREKYRRNGK